MKSILFLLLAGLVFSLSVSTVCVAEETVIYNPNIPAAIAEGEPGIAAVNWSFEIIAPDRVALPGDWVQWRYRVENSSGSTGVLTLWLLSSIVLPNMNFSWANTQWPPPLSPGQSWEGNHIAWQVKPTAPCFITLRGPLGAGAVDPADPPYQTMDVSLRVGCKVEIDIKPGSCPNPLNPKSKGSVPVAIVGTGDFDPVAMVDPSTVTLAGVPMNGIVEIVDSTQPHKSDPNAEECHDCFDAEPDFAGDGYDDLVVKFDTQALVAAIAGMGGAARDGCIDLILEGETYDGVPIVGGDSMLVRKGIDASPAPPAPGAHNLTTAWGNIKSP